MVVSRIAASTSGAPGRKRTTTPGRTPASRSRVARCWGKPQVRPVGVAPTIPGEAERPTHRSARGAPQEHFFASLRAHPKSTSPQAALAHGTAFGPCASPRGTASRSWDDAYQPGRSRTPHSPFRSGRTPGVLLRGMAHGTRFGAYHPGRSRTPHSPFRSGRWKGRA